jgi:hypothetical protein
MSDIVEMIRGESEVALVRPEWVEDWKGLGWALKGEGIVPAAATPLDADGLKVGKGTDDELVKLAGELSGEPITELNGETPAQRAKSIIQAAVDDRASKA